MKPVHVGVLITLAAAVAATAVVGIKRKPAAPTTELEAKQRSTEIDAGHVARPEAPRSSTTKTRANDVAGTIEDYGALIDKLLPLAEDGNAKAQYDVYEATTYCQERVRFYFTRRGRRLTLEEGLAWAIERNVSYETAQAVHKQCGKFLEMDPKDQSGAVNWLNAAAKQGYAPAQSALAAKILEDQQRRGFASASGIATAASTESLDRTKSATELLREAVKSRDPEVLFTIGEMIPLIHPTAAEVDSERLAWMALACERGFDCSAQAEWVVASCLSAECQSINSPNEVVRILAGDRWIEVRARARELGASLDAGRWDQLGLGSG